MWDNTLELSGDELEMVKALLRETADSDYGVAMAAQHKLAKAL